MHMNTVCLKQLAIVYGFLCLVPVCSGRASEDPNVIKQARDMIQRGERDTALALLDQARAQSDQPWLYVQEMGKILFYQLREGVSVFAEDQRGDVFGPGADRAVTLFEEAIAAAPERTFESRKLLAYLLFDRGEYTRTSQVLSEGLAYFGQEPDYVRQVRYLNEKMAVQRYTPWVYGTGTLLTLVLLHRIISLHRGRFMAPAESGTLKPDQELVLESTLQNTKWGALVLVCAWTITLFLGPSSLAAMIYGDTLLGRAVEGLIVAIGLFFFGSTFLFFGKKVLVCQANGFVTLRDVSLFGRKIDWQVKTETLSRVVTQKAYAYVFVYAVPRTIACMQILLQDQGGRHYPVLRTPRQQEAMTLAESLCRTLNLQLESEG
jgi:hypothetical protein